MIGTPDPSGRPAPPEGPHCAPSGAVSPVAAAGPTRAIPGAEDRGTARFTRLGRFALIEICNPPANALSLGVRREIAEGLRQTRDNPGIDGLVMTGSDDAFCSGADIRQFGTPAYWASPRTRDLVGLIDTVGKPVVAAIGGFAMGGGLELAMAAHSRVALPGSRLGLPEVRLGVIPAAGGILRLPRLVPASRALALMMSGEAVDAVEAREIGLIDGIAQGDLRDCAFARLEQLIGRADLVRTIDRPILLSWGDQDHEPETEPRVEPGRRRGGAREALRACFRAALKYPPERVDRLIQRHSNRLVDSPEAHALRYVFFGRRSVSAGSVPAGTKALPVRNVAISGVGGRPDALREKAGLLNLSVVADHDADLLLAFDPSSEDAPVRARFRQDPGLPVGNADRETGILLRGAAPLPELMEYPIDGSCRPEPLAALMSFARRFGITPVPVRRLGIGDRLWRVMRRAAEDLLEDDVRAGTVNAALADWGFRQPLLAAADGDSPRLPDEMKTKIIKHCFEAIIQEGNAIIDEKLVGTRLAIDMILVAGYGFPDRKGGIYYNKFKQGSAVGESSSWI